MSENSFDKAKQSLHTNGGMLSPCNDLQEYGDKPSGAQLLTCRARDSASKADCLVRYLGHSAWAVQIGEYLLVFDYSDDFKPYHDENKSAGLNKGVVALEQHRDKKVILIFSHDHHDHYSPSLHKESLSYENVYIVLGDFEANPSERTFTIRAQEKLTLGDVCIYAGASTDKGCCFLMQVAGQVIFFGGDNADWGDGDDANQLFYPILDAIAQIGLPVDIAFIPVCTSNGNRPQALTDSALYTVSQLNPKIVFPMHANGREYLYELFQRDYQKGGYENLLVCLHARGQAYSI